MPAVMERVDFFRIEPHQFLIHGRLENWARYVDDKPRAWMSPMFRMTRSGSRQWHPPDVQVPVNGPDGFKLEKAVGFLPIPHRDAIRWFYVSRTTPRSQCKRQAVSETGLFQLVRDGRQMLINRGA